MGWREGGGRNLRVQDSADSSRPVAFHMRYQVADSLSSSRNRRNPHVRNSTAYPKTGPASAGAAEGIWHPTIRRKGPAEKGARFAPNDHNAAKARGGEPLPPKDDQHRCPNAGQRCAGGRILCKIGQRAPWWAGVVDRPL